MDQLQESVANAPESKNHRLTTKPQEIAGRKRKGKREAKMHEIESPRPKKLRKLIPDDLRDLETATNADEEAGPSSRSRGGGHPPPAEDDSNDETGMLEEENSELHYESDDSETSSGSSTPESFESEGSEFEEEDLSEFEGSEDDAANDDAKSYGNVEDPALDLESEEEAVAAHIDPGKSPEDSETSKTLLEKYVMIVKKQRNKDEDQGSNLDGYTYERDAGKSERIWDISRGFLLDCAETCKEQEDPAYSYTVFFRDSVNNTAANDAFYKMDTAWVEKEGIEKNIRGAAQEIMSMWWLRLMRPVWHVNKVLKEGLERPACSYNLKHVFLSEVPDSTGFALPRDEQELALLKLPVCVIGNLKRDCGIDGIAVYELCEEDASRASSSSKPQSNRLYVVLQSKAAISAPWIKSQGWASPIRFLSAGQSLVRQIEEEGGVCVLLWFSNLMSPPNECVPTRNEGQNYKDLVENDQLMYTTMETLNGEFVAGMFMACLAESLKRNTRNNEQTIPTLRSPRLFQVGLVNAAKRVDQERQTAGLPTANFTSSQPCGAGKTLGSYFCTKEMENQYHKPSLVSTCRLRLVQQFMIAWCEQERAEFLAAGNTTAVRKLHYYAVCMELPNSIGHRVLRSEAEIVGTICKAIRCCIEETKDTSLEKESRSRYRFFTTYQSGLEFARCVRYATQRLCKEIPSSSLEPLFGTVIRDEAHLATGPGWDGFCAILEVHGTLGVSLTATPRFWEGRKPRTALPDDIPDDAFDSIDGNDKLRTIEDAQAFVDESAIDLGTGAQIPSEKEGNSAANIAMPPQQISSTDVAQASPANYYAASGGDRALIHAVARAFGMRASSLEKLARISPLSRSNSKDSKSTTEEWAPPTSRGKLESELKKLARAVWASPNGCEKPPLIAFQVSTSSRDAFTTEINSDGNVNYIPLHPDDRMFPKLQTDKDVIAALKSPAVACIGFTPAPDTVGKVNYSFYYAERQRDGNNDAPSKPLVHDMSGQDPRCPHGNLAHAVSLAAAVAAGVIGQCDFYLLDVASEVLDALGGDAPDKKRVTLALEKLSQNIFKESLPEKAFSEIEVLKASGQEVLAAFQLVNIIKNDVEDRMPSGFPRKEYRKVLGFSNSVKGALRLSALIGALLESFAPKSLGYGDPTMFYNGAVFSSTKDLNGGSVQMDTLEQDKELGLFKLAKRGILMNYRLIDIGYDFPGINTIAFPEPTNSTERFIQGNGRGSRSKTGYDLFLACPSDPEGASRRQRILKNMKGKEPDGFEDGTEMTEEGRSQLLDAYAKMKETMAKAYVDQLTVLGEIFKIAADERGSKGVKSATGNTGLLTLGFENVDVVRLPVGITSSLVEAINSVKSPLRRPWKDRYDDLKALLAELKRWPRSNSKDERERDLSTFADSQCYEYKMGRLGWDKLGVISREEKIRLLEALPNWKDKAGGDYGWRKDLPQRRTWKEKYISLTAWISRNSCWPPHKSAAKTPEEIELSDFVSSQCTFYRIGKLSKSTSCTIEEKRALLEKLDGWKSKAGGEYGFAINLPKRKNWEENFQSMMTLRQSSPSIAWPSPPDSVGVWLRNQCYRYKRGTLSGHLSGAEKANLLETLPGWTEYAKCPKYGALANNVEKVDTSFLALYDQILQWKEEAEDANAWPERSTRMGRWISRIKSDYCHGRLRDEEGTTVEEKQQRLEELAGWEAYVKMPYGFLKDNPRRLVPFKERWDDVQERLGDSSLSFIHFPTKGGVGSWLQLQKREYLRGTIRPEVNVGGLGVEQKKDLLHQISGWDAFVGGGYGSQPKSKNTTKVDKRKEYQRMLDELRDWRIKHVFSRWPDSVDADTPLELVKWYKYNLESYRYGTFSNSPKARPLKQEKIALLEGLQGWKSHAGEYGQRKKKPPTIWMDGYEKLRVWKGEDATKWPGLGKDASDDEKECALWLKTSKNQYQTGSLKTSNGKTADEKKLLLEALPGWKEKIGGYGELEKTAQELKKIKNKFTGWRVKFQELIDWKVNRGEDDWPSTTSTNEAEKAMAKNIVNLEFGRYRTGTLSKGNDGTTVEEKIKLMEALPGFRKKIKVECYGANQKSSTKTTQQ